MVVLAHLSDLHFGADDPVAAASLTADVRAFDPAVTVVTGDLTQRARSRQFAAAVAFLDRLPAPRLVVLGNHDVPLDSLQRLTAPYRQYREHVQVDLDPVLDADGVRVLGLASMPRWRWKGGRVSRRQTDLVTTVLGGRVDGAAASPQVRVLALHHPVSLTGPATLVGRGRLLTALARARVELVLAGHTHRSRLTWLEVLQAERPWCVLQGVAGTATSTRLRGTRRSWTLYRIGPTEISVEERVDTGAAWEVARVARFPRQPPPEPLR